ncbi:hypothetical protein [Snuella sedimenti]|uniref:Fibronectin type-III domain-containing protein n=1 Tax=Snuella sedimenti TaxID=2798802 RepID=A0A8J7IRT1_9FLAO|nr:hypothetical protein [Snuella sedimenti]MBJ6366665.1 hypothetical protein [Snuella sedimenti]
MKKLIYISIALLVVSCSSGGDSSEEKKASNPEKAVLVFPENNSECLEGQIINSQKSTVNFKWSKANSADSYDISIRNLNDQTVKLHTTTNTSLDVEIDRGTPYSWYVVSKSKKGSTTAKSDTWKFYNAGEGVTEHVPFPAEIVAPLYNETITVSNGKVTLDWDGSDVDGDIDSYEVFFGEVNPPGSFQTNLQESVLNDVSVSSGKTYYWKVKTKDGQGNVSYSDVFTFEVN